MKLAQVTVDNGFVATKPGLKKFEGDIPLELNNKFERWLELRPGITKRGFGAILFHMFFMAPEWLQEKAVAASDAELKRVLAVAYPGEGRAESSGGAETGSPEEMLEGFRRSLSDLEPETIRLLSPKEQQTVDELRRVLGPSEDERRAKAIGDAAEAADLRDREREQGRTARSRRRGA